jgi:hypothetical protein
MKQACVDCEKSLICVTLPGPPPCCGCDHANTCPVFNKIDDGVASMCTAHDIAFIYTKPDTAPAQNMDGAVLGVSWTSSGAFAELFGVECNCKAAALCPHLSQFA